MRPSVWAAFLLSLVLASQTGWALGWSVSYNGSQDSITSLGVYNGKLYAGQGYWNAGVGDVYSYDGNPGSSWTKSYDSALHDVYALKPYNNKLYAALYDREGCHSEIRSYNGTTWSRAYAEIGCNYTKSFAEYNGKLYAGKGSNCMIRSYDGTTWQTAYQGNMSCDIVSLAVYNGRLYAALDPYTTWGDIIAFDGSTWTLVYKGYAEHIGQAAPSLAVYNGKLYAGFGSVRPYGKILAYNGTTWENSYSIDKYPAVLALLAHDGKLYAGMRGYSNQTGDVLVFYGGAWSLFWTGSAMGSYSLASYGGKLYVGTGFNYGEGDVIALETEPGTTTTTTTTTTTSTSTTSSSTTSFTTTTSTTTTSQGTTTSTTSTSTTTTTTTTTTMETSCAMPGNVPPCALVSLGEVVSAINDWANGWMSLQAVIDLINSWADPATYMPF